MCRTKPKKTKRIHDPLALKNAVRSVRLGMKIRQASKQFSVDKETLRRYVKKSTLSDDGDVVIPAQNYNWKKVFTAAEEEELVDYLIELSRLGHGLNRIQCCELAYEMAEKNEIEVPPKWHAFKTAGIEWFKCFKKRHPRITMRTPESCSLGRGICFNKHNVSLFFDNLEKILKRSPDLFQDGSRIFNLDETATKTVQTPGRILAGKGARRVSQNTSGEKGILVTTCVFVSASGVVYPPVMIFPRVNFRSIMLSGAYPGTVGLAEKSGWMTKIHFAKVIDHFVKVTGSSKPNPSLLIYDNHESHLSISVIDIARASGVTILTIPPHTSHRLQPLDVSVFCPFQRAYDSKVNSWMMENGGQVVSIYNIAEFVNAAIEKGVTPRNIMNGFKACGIYPFNRNIFTEEDFATARITERPLPVPNKENEENNAPVSPFVDGLDELLMPVTEHGNLAASTSIDLELLPEIEDHSIQLDFESLDIANLDFVMDIGLFEDLQVSPRVHVPIDIDGQSNEEDSDSRNIIPSVEFLSEVDPTEAGPPSFSPVVSTEPSTEIESDLKVVNPHGAKSKDRRTKAFISPSVFRGYPVKSAQEPANRKRRKNKTSIIATGTPVRNQLEEEEKARKNKKSGSKKSEKMKKAQCVKKLFDHQPSRKKSSSTETKEPENSAVQPVQGQNKDHSSIAVNSNSSETLQLDPKIDDFILVSFDSNKKSGKKYCIGKVIGDKDSDGDLEVSFLRQSSNGVGKFVMPSIPDLASVNINDVQLILPKPFCVGTKRQASIYDFSGFDLSRFPIT